EELYRLHVDGTKILLEEAISAGIRTVVFVSSLAVYGTAINGMVDENTPAVPVTAYGQSKLHAEDVVRSAYAGSALRHIILRPAMVYGPRMKGNPLRLFDLVNRGIPLLLKGIHNRRSLLYVSNLAAAVVCAISSTADSSDTYVVAESPAVSSPDLVRIMAEALGRPSRLFSLPCNVVKLAGKAGDLLARGRHFPFTSRTFDSLWGSFEVDYSRI